MPRKPVHLERAGGRLALRDRLWAVIRELRRFTVPELRGALRGATSLASIRSYVAGLESAGYVERVGLDGQSPVFWLRRDVGVEAPRVRNDGSAVAQGGAREQMWRTCRVLGEFSARELAVAASTPDCTVIEVDAKSYVRYLHVAGYLAMTRQGGPGVLARYRMLPSRYTGPRAPMVQRIRQVFDPNEGRVVWRAGEVRS